MGITKIDIIGYSAGATAALLSSIGTNPFNQYGLKIPDRNVVNKIFAIAGSLTTPSEIPVTAHQYLDKDSPNTMIWIGSDDTVVAASGAQEIKKKYDEIGSSANFVLHYLQDVDHDTIWNIPSADLLNTNYNNKLPLDAALLFIQSN